MKKKLLILTLMLIAILLAGGSGVYAATCYPCSAYQGHSSCENPSSSYSTSGTSHVKKCCCGKGNVSSHTATWNAATCTKAKTCKTCGMTSGSALGHDYTKACPTCSTANQKCSRCNDIQKHDAVNPTLTAYTGSYDGSSHTISVSGGAGGTIQYSTDNSSWSTTEPTRENAGTTTVYVRIKGDTNHNTTSSVNAKITINKVNASMTKPTAKTGLTYTGSAQTLVSEGSAVGGTIEYALGSDTTTAPTSDWSTTLPKGTNARTFYVWSRVVADGNHNDVAAAYACSVTIAKKSITVTWGSTVSFAYDGNSHAPTVTTPVDGVNGEKVNLTVSGAQTTVGSSYTATASISSVTNGQAKAANYSLSGNTKTFSITKVNASMTKPTAKTGLTYTGSAQTLVNAGSAVGGTIEYALGSDTTTAPTSDWATTLPTGTNAGTYYVWSKVVADGNHNDVAAAYACSVTIGTKAMTASVTNGTATYNGNPTNGGAKITVSDPASGATIKYGTASGTYNLDTIPTYTNAGTYTVYYQITATNYEAKTGSLTIIISKAAGSISYATTSVTNTYGDAAFTNNLTNTGDGAVTYSSSNTNVATVNTTTGEVTIVGAGEATITATVADSATHTYATNTASYELTVNKKTPTLTVSNKSVKIDEIIDAMFEYDGDGTTLEVTSGSTSIAEITSSALNTKTIKVKGIALGSTTVTVTITGGTNYEDITETFIVTVNDTNIEITTQPANQTIFKDQNATFSIVAEGSNLTYQWYKAEDGSSSGTAIDGATNRTYTLSNATIAMDGTYYYCKVTSSAGSVASDRAKLTVNKLEGNIAYIASDKKLTNLKVGDWVDYQSDSQGETTGWRVWAIEGDKVIIKPVGTPKLSIGATSGTIWNDIPSKIEEECKKFTNASLNITSEDIRSLTLEEIEAVTEIGNKKNNYINDNGKRYGEIVTYTFGGFIAYLNKTTGEYELVNGSNQKVNATESKPLSVINNYYKYNGDDIGWKTIPGSSTITYGDLINGSIWLPTIFANATASGPEYGVYYVRKDVVGGNILAYQNSLYIRENFVAPLVTLDASKIQIANDNTGNGTSKAKAYKISLADTKVEKTYGDSAFTKELTKTGDGAVTYASSNTDVATINATTGEVTIIGAGTATITATVTDSATYTYPVKTASYELTVNKKAPTLTVNPTSLSIILGNTATAAIIYDGDGLLSAPSNATGIATATVANKVVTVTAVGGGTATITVTAAEGANYLGATATISVTVQANPSTPTITVTNADGSVASNTWSNKDLSITIGGSTIGGSATNVGYKYSYDGSTWYVYNGAIAYTTETQDAVIYAKAYNKLAESAESSTVSYNIKLDKTAPAITLGSSSITYGATTTITLSDSGAGVGGYAVTSSTAVPTSWTNYSSAVTWGSGMSAGTYYVHAKDNVGNTTYKIVTVNTKSVNDLTVSLDTSTYTYDNTAKTPTVTVKDGDNTLVKDTDYTVAYTNNTNAGTATVTITGKGNYSGTKDVTFTINKALPTLTVNPTSINMVAGNKATSNVTYNADGELSVSSSATGVATATVANKLVTITGVSAGTATITVSATEGDNYLANTTTINVLVRVANYYDDKGINYTTLDEAFNDAETGSIIKPYRDMEESATATVPAGKTIVLDLDGKKITAPREESSTLIINNGTLELKDSGAGGEIRLDSNYVEDINVSTIPGIEKKMVVNNGTLTVSSGIYTSRADDGKVVVIESNGVTNVTGGVINATNNGNEGYSRAIVTNGGTLNVSAGTISASANSIYNCYAIVNEGISATDINITGGEISGDRGAIYIAKRDATCLDNNTTLSVSGNAVIESSKGYGIYNNFSVNDIEITGGNIHAGIDGIYNEESKVIVGTKDGNVLVSSPIIAGDVRGIASVKGIELYDGKLEGKIKSIEGTVVAKEDGYEVYNSSEPNDDGYYETFLKKVSELEVSVEILELIAQGDDGTITYTYEGDGIITATSSDESVATVVVNETDHTITVTPIKAGNVEITIVAPDTDTYIGSEVSVKVSVEPAEFEITLDTEIYTYDGNPCTPEITVVANGEELVEGEDYEIEYVDNVNAGTATVIIRGIGDYEGSTKEVIFRINKAQVNVPTGKELLYTGSMQTGVDDGDLYRLLNNTGVDVGEYTATAILKDKINYEWSETESSDDYEVSWKIAGKLMTLDAMSIESISDKQYTGSAITPKPTVTDVELHKTLVENTDFTYSYENNVEVGVATVTITGKGIYAGTLDTIFNILPSNYSITKGGVTTYFETLAQAVNSISVDGVTIKLLTDNYTDTSDVVIDKQIILDTNGKTLIKKDHSIDVDSTGTLKVIGAGTVTASNVDTITNSGKVYIETANTKIENTATSTYCAIRNDGTLNVSNGSVTADNIAIIASGTVNVSGGIVESDGSSAIKVVSSGSVNVSNNAKVIGNGGSAITSESTKVNAINITGGRIEATGKAVNNIANTVITLGTKDGNITKNAPVIISTGDVAVYSAGGINFYDGLLLSENSSNVFTGEIIDTEANCTVVKEDCVYEATSYHSAFIKQEGKLDIEAEDIKLYAPGDDGVMTYTYVGNGDISVTSSNNEIATVTVDEENHKIIIHPVKEGEVTITVSSGETDTCTADSKEIAVKVICSEMDVTLSETTYDYNGTERKPDVTVKTGEGKELVEGIDYTVSYENNTNAGTATVKVTGIGDYEGINETTTFTINKIVVTVPTGKELVYNGSIQVGVDAGELYDISGNSAIKIGEYTAIAKLKDTFNYEWNTAKDDNADKQISWKILGKVISIENIEVENVEDQTYTGNEIKPTPVVKDVALDAILVNSLDFKYTYTNNVNAGTATITITGLGNYTGSIAVTFDILPIKVEVPVGKTLTYNGLEQTGVEPNALYTLTNNKKTNAGEYVATARLISQVNYEWVTGGSEEKEIAWKILAKDLRDVTVGNISDYTYNGKAIKPTPAVIDEERGTSLTAGTDFEYSYNDNIDAGTATLTITFKNNYEGEKEFKFVINRKEVEVVWGNTELSYDGTERVPTAIVNSGVTGETINLEVTGSGKSDVGTGYESTARIASVTGGRAEASNYLLTNTKVSYSILADNYFVGGLYYHTLAEAMEAADSTDTIEVMNNVTDESEEIAIPSDKDITIETNGYAVRIPDGKAIEVATGGSLTIAGTGTISGKGESEAIPVINSLGEVKIDGAKVVNTNPSGYAIIVSGNGELDLSSGTINGKVKAKDSSNINVTGGTIMSSSNDKTVTLVDNASLDITSGTISANIGGTAIDTSSTNEVTIGGDARVTGAATGIRVTNGDVIITGGTVISEEGYAIANVSGRVVIGKEDDDVSQSSPVIRGNKAAYVSYENDAEIEVYDGVLQSKSNCIVYVSNDGTVNINNRTPEVYIGEGKEVGVAKGYQLSSMKSLVEGLTYNIAFLRAEQLPRISGPKDVTVMRGEKATFEVEATSGIPNVYTYKWYVSHNNGSTWEEISGEEEASYTIPVITLDMNANLYRVVVSNGLAEDVTSRDAKLIVKDSKDDNGPVDMVPIGRFTFVNDEKISKYKGNDVAELELIIKTTSELATLTLNNVNIPVNGAGETNVNGNAIVVKNDEIVVRNSKDEIAEYAYTFKVYAKENGNFVAKFTDEKGHSSSVTQTIEVFKNALTVAYSIQEPTIYQKYSVVTFTANRNVKFVEPVEYAESMNKIGSGEYVNKYTFNVYANLPETTFAFEDSSGYVATVTLSINDSGIRYLRFTNDAQDIDSITLEEAFTKAQNMENEIEANEKQGVQSRYGTTARQTDMFLSRARDIGAADILANASVTKAYDQVLPKEIAGSGTYDGYGLVGSRSTYVAGYTSSVENKLTTATRQYVDKLPTSMNLYKGILDTSKIVYDNNMEDTSFRATIIVK